MLSITVIVIIVAAVSGPVNENREQQLLNTMIPARTSSKGITSATWHAMLDDHREAA